MAPHRTPPRAACLVEPLERRQLLSASVGAMQAELVRSLADARGSLAEQLESTSAVAFAKDSTVSPDSAAFVATSPAPPSVLLDTTYVPGTGNKIVVPAGGNVQNAINAAQPGDTIELAAGATFTGNFTLPNKSGNAWVTIRTSTPDASLPAPGTRITPAQSNLMAKLVSPNSNPALATQNNAHNYRFIGIEFTIAANVVENWGIVNVGSGSQTAAQTARDLIFDRVYIHGRPNTQIQNGMRLNSARTAIIDSYFDQIQSTIFEGHCIGGYNGPGPFKIVNNTFNGGTIPVIFGGAKPSVDGLIPSDMEIRGNHFTRPLSWRPGDPSYAGTAWYVKNLFELKNGQRVLFEGNLLEHNWPHTGSTPDGSPQHGFAILLTVRDEGNTAEWTTVSDINLSNNIIRKSNVGISISGTEGVGTHRVKLENNVFDDIGLNWGNNDRSGMLAQVNTVGDLIFNHNTIVNDGDILFANGAEVGDLDFTNNIVKHDAARTINNNRGINAPGFAIGNASLAAKFVQFDVTKNVMVDNTPAASYPAGNFFPANFAAVGFTNLGARDYRLAPSSAYNNAGTDGKDIGADIDVLATATAGAVTGAWPQVLQGMSVNGGAAQRSRVTSLTLTFNQPMTLGGGALGLARRGGTTVGIVASASPDQRTYTLTFSGAGITAGSLDDGIYDFVVDSIKLRDAFGATPVGLRTDVDPALATHRLYGDHDGNKGVDILDYNAFLGTYRKRSGQSGFLAHFDSSGDGVIDILDYNQFLSRYRTRFVY